MGETGGLVSRRPRRAEHEVIGGGAAGTYVEHPLGAVTLAEGLLVQVGIAGAEVNGGPVVQEIEGVGDGGDPQDGERNRWEIAQRRQRANIVNENEPLASLFTTNYSMRDRNAEGAETITNDALSYDILSQVAQAVRNPGASLVDPLGGLPRAALFSCAAEGYEVVRVRPVKAPRVAVLGEPVLRFLDLPAVGLGDVSNERFGIKPRGG